MPKATKPETTTAIFAPLKRSHLYAVETPKQHQKFKDDIRHSVATLVQSDEKARALCFLIDLATGIYRTEISLGNDRSSDLDEGDRKFCAITILEEAFTLSPSHGTALRAWLGLEDAEPEKKAKAG